MLQPIEGFWSSGAGRPSSTASRAARRSAPVRRPPLEYSVQGRAQICARHRHVVARPAVVELAAIDEMPVLVVDEEIRRARRPEGLGRLLGLVEEIGERVTPGRDLLGHHLRPVVGVVLDVVGGWS
jgi:hypothetical protein